MKFKCLVMFPFIICIKHINQSVFNLGFKVLFESKVSVKLIDLGWQYILNSQYVFKNTNLNNIIYSKSCNELQNYILKLPN